jgi:hypothetical protein
LGHFVEAAVGPPDIDTGQDEGRDDHGKSEENSKGRDTRPDLGGKKSLRERDEENESEIDDEHCDRERPRKARSLPDKFLKARIPKNFVVIADSHSDPPLGALLLCSVPPPKDFMLDGMPTS